MKSEGRNYQVRKIRGNYYQSAYLITWAKDEERIKNSIPDKTKAKMVIFYDEIEEEEVIEYDHEHLISLVDEEEREILWVFFEDFHRLKSSKEQEVIEVFEKISFTNRKFFKYSIERGRSRKFKTWVLSEIHAFDFSEAQLILDYFDERFLVEDFSFSGSSSDLSGVVFKLHDSEKAKFLQEIPSMEMNSEGEVTISAKDLQGIAKSIDRKKKIAVALKK